MREVFEAPIGLGPELSKKEQKLPALEVDNIVAWSNPHFPAIQMREGEKSSLGLFFDPSPESPGEITELAVHVGHYRSALLGRAIFQDDSGNFYRDIDLKGTGYLRQREEDRGKLFVGKHPGKRYQSEAGPWGLADEEIVEYDRDNCEKFIAMGIRTYRVLAIIKLKELVDSSGKKISIAEAQKQGIIGADLSPVIEVRAYGTKMRVEDAERNFDCLRDGMALAAQEQGIPIKDFTADKYLSWFAETIAEQALKMHQAGYTHGSLGTHNITLDCRIVDLDSIEEHGQNSEEERAQIDKDLRFVKAAIKSLHSSLSRLPASDLKDAQEYIEKMEETYFAAV